MMREQDQNITDQQGHVISVWQARDRLTAAIAEHRRGALTLDALYAHADAYIAEIKAYGERTGRKLPVPSRAKIIRVLE